MKIYNLVKKWPCMHTVRGTNVPTSLHKRATDPHYMISDLYTSCVLNISMDLTI